MVTYLNNWISFLILDQLTNNSVYIFVPENSVFRKQCFIFLYFHVKYWIFTNSYFRNNI